MDEREPLLIRFEKVLNVARMTRLIHFLIFGNKWFFLAKKQNKTKQKVLIIEKQIKLINRFYIIAQQQKQ